MDLVVIPTAVLILSTLSIWIFSCYWAVTGPRKRSFFRKRKLKAFVLILSTAVGMATKSINHVFDHYPPPTSVQTACF